MPANRPAAPACPGQDFTWEADGSISGERTTLGLPALSYLLPTDAGWRAWNKVGFLPRVA